MKQLIKDMAKDIGIDLIGFTTVIDYSYLKNYFVNRANLGYNNEFEEADLDKRLNVKSIFPNCKSIIAVGIPYGIGYKKPNVNNKGLLSVVSYGQDYHIRLTNILNELARKILNHKSFDYKVIVDTSWLIDREICKNSGIGSYGKNSLLINEEWGSFINIGYILTDLDIKDEEHVTEQKDICKDCNICVRSCPNNAILAEGGINARKCVSYLTQTKTYIPYDYRKNMKNQIYGCDICQLVCPKNKKILSMNTNNDYNELLVDLEELMTISNNDYKKRYGALSGSWRGKNIWKRNAIISIANLKLDYLFDSIVNELDNTSEMIRIYSAWSLIMLNKQKSKKILYSKMKDEDDIIKTEYMKLLEAD